MRREIVPNNREIRLDASEFIVSKTDTRGVITYANRTFMKIAGYSELELLGMPHNIVRHADMPRGVFKLMWSTLQAGEEFFGYVKNLCKDGSFYWVLANVTPDRDAAGHLRGYYSVRRKPSPENLAILIPIYQQMAALEQQAKGQEAIQRSQTYLAELLKTKNTDYTSFVLDLVRKDISS
ncbi:aerotaxis receptor [Azomonas agilis]|uniref:Aerotaxis receptor n=1 Tax=Azomonas agilis TaxID=116849 RepID=A0A562I2N2_9GAMM|nr:PAS domain-containing protein [Azomonas agilis]TWH64913.1 aerotaxis receptor [Azomonas agilis]